MPLNTPKLEDDIFDLLTEQSKRTENPAQARRDFARDLATAITAHVRTGTVTTTGTAATQTGTIS